MSELKKCPFCGKKAEIESVFYGREKFNVKCSNCPACTGHLGYHKKVNAITAWNTRTSPLVDELVEALEKCIEPLVAYERCLHGYASESARIGRRENQSYWEAQTKDTLNYWKNQKRFSPKPERS